MQSSITKLAKSIHSDSTTVVISALDPRNNNFDHKRVEVNHYLKLESSKCNVAFIEHDNIDQHKHLNRSGLHLNTTGTAILSYNFLSFSCVILK